MGFLQLRIHPHTLNKIYTAKKDLHRWLLCMGICPNHTIASGLEGLKDPLPLANLNSHQPAQSRKWQADLRLNRLEVTQDMAFKGREGSHHPRFLFFL